MRNLLYFFLVFVLMMTSVALSFGALIRARALAERAQQLAEEAQARAPLCNDPAKALRAAETEVWVGDSENGWTKIGCAADQTLDVVGSCWKRNYATKSVAVSKMGGVAEPTFRGNISGTLRR